MRVERCFAFLDLCGFTAYTEEHGDNAAVAILAQLRAIVRAEAEREGVRVTKWLGDGVMLSGAQSGLVVACAGDVRDRISGTSPLELRGGICAGAVIMFEGDDYIGAAVNVAARLCSVARPGQIVMTERVGRAVRDRRATTRLEPVHVRGVRATVELVELGDPLD